MPLGILQLILPPIATGLLMGGIFTVLIFNYSV